MLFNRKNFGVTALAAATLLLESTLTRFLAVAQYYHFAFLVVSLALLGFGASGSLLYIFSVNRLWNSFHSRLDIQIDEQVWLRVAGLAFAISTALAYTVTNWLPFDSYLIAWDWRQVVYFVMYYLALSIPFLFAGLGIGAILSASKNQSHLVYAANLLGSGIGALLAPAFLWIAGVPGGVLASGLIGLLAAYLSFPSRSKIAPKSGVLNGEIWRVGILVVLVLGGILISFLGADNLAGRSKLGMVISPYKGLSQANRYPGSETIFSRWNAISRVDVVIDAGTRLMPGLSYTYTGPLPVQIGLSQDADALLPITLDQPGQFEAGDYLPEALAFILRPKARVLVLEPGGGLGVLQALSGNAEQVITTVSNPLVIQAIQTTNPNENIFTHPNVHVVVDTPRVFIERGKSHYEIVYLPLTDAYRPVTSGAYSLAETFTLTIEAFESMFERLTPDGILVLTRWLQTPASEELRLVNTIIASLENRGALQPRESIIAYRGIQTMTVLVQPGGWTPAELHSVDSFLQGRRFDLVWAPDISPEEVNRFNRLQEPVYYQLVKQLFDTSQRQMLVNTYPFMLSPPTDDKPFFFHFYTWRQTPELLATLGRTWQPFGGSGYLVLLALLVFVIVFSTILILAPVIISRRMVPKKLIIDRNSLFFPSPLLRIGGLRVFLYFSLLGVAFLFVEIPLIQRWILFLGHPTYAFVTVVVGLLTFSSLGSALARSAWLPRKLAFGTLVLLVLITPWLTLCLGYRIMDTPFIVRAGIAGLSLAPLAVLMGLPFPLGLTWLEYQAPELIPWAWAVNGCASVVSAVLAAILALSYGFKLVLILGAVAYGGAFAIIFSQLSSNGRLSKVQTGQDPD